MLAFFGAGGLGFWELVVIMAIVMLLFGAKRIPELARGLGLGISEFKRGMSDPAAPAAPTTPPTAEPQKLPENSQKV